MIFIQYCIIFYVVFLCYLIQNARSAPKKNIDNSKRISSRTIDRSSIYLRYTMVNDAKLYLHKYGNNVQNPLISRVKRQSSAGAGKFADAAKMPQIKTFRLFLQLFKNLWTDAPIGGAGPLAPEVVKPVLYLFKDKIIAFFFPDPREEHKKKSH